MKKILSIAMFLVIISNVGLSFASYQFFPDQTYFNWPTISRNITSDFGETRPGGRTHTGIDVGGVKPGVVGDSLYAIRNGRVDNVYTPFYGRLLAINFDMIGTPYAQGTRYLQSTYTHITNQVYVTAGTTVTKGQLVAKMGGSGDPNAKSGPLKKEDGYVAHLHFEMKKIPAYTTNYVWGANVVINPTIFYTAGIYPSRVALSISKSLIADEFSALVENGGELETYDSRYGVIVNNCFYPYDSLK